MFELKNSTALITGASSGFGAEFARQLGGVARRLVLVARRGEILKEMKAELEAAHLGLEVFEYAADLTSADDRGNFVGWLGENDLEPNLLINNAGIGDYGDFGDSEWGKVDALLQLNVVALTHLTHALLPGLRKASGAAIINVSSLASVMPIPDFAAYAASKAYVTSFSESLRHELKADLVNVVAVCPGPVKTGFGDGARREGSKKMEPPGSKYFYNDAQSVVTDGLRAAEANRARVFPGVPVFLAAAVIETLPEPILRFILGRRKRHDEPRD